MPTVGMRFKNALIPGNVRDRDQTHKHGWTLDNVSAEVSYFGLRSAGEIFCPSGDLNIIVVPKHHIENAVTLAVVAAKSVTLKVW